MAGQNVQKSKGLGSTTHAKVEAATVWLHIRKRPVSDGRIRTLIPTLIGRCGLANRTFGHGSYVAAAGQVFSNSARVARADVRSAIHKQANATELDSKKAIAHYVNSIDLQLLTLTNQRLFGQKSWVDVLENDVANLQHNGRRSGLHLSTWVWIAHFLQNLLPWNNFITIAEECFYNEIKFGSAKPILLPHELVPVEQMEQLPADGLPVVLVTGTLGRHYGTLDALSWSLAHQVSFPHQLRIAGPCPDPSFRTELEAAAATHPEIEIEIWDSYAPQAQVLQRMAGASYLLCPYVLSPATQNRIPTKFAEARALGLSLIIPRNPAWTRWCLARDMPFRFLDTPAQPEIAGRQGLDQSWVTQRKALQWQQALQGVARLLAD